MSEIDINTTLITVAFVASLGCLYVCDYDEYVCIFCITILFSKYTILLQINLFSHDIIFFNIHIHFSSNFGDSVFMYVVIVAFQQCLLHQRIGVHWVRSTGIWCEGDVGSESKTLKPYKLSSHIGGGNRSSLVATATARDCLLPIKVRSRIYFHKGITHLAAGRK